MGVRCNSNAWITVNTCPCSKGLKTTRAGQIYMNLLIMAVRGIKGTFTTQPVLIETLDNCTDKDLHLTSIWPQTQVQWQTNWLPRWAIGQVNDWVNDLNGVINKWKWKLSVLVIQLQKNTCEVVMLCSWRRLKDIGSIQIRGMSSDVDETGISKDCGKYI